MRMVAKMAGIIAVLVMALIVAALLLWNLRGVAGELAKERDAALVRATNAEDRAKAEVRRASRSAAAADAQRRKAELDLSRALTQLRTLSRNAPETRAWLLTPVPAEVKSLLKEDDGRETP